MPSFTPHGVCSTQIDFEIDEDGLLHNISFTKGCPGNAIGVAKLAEGRPASEIIELFESVLCGHKATSCPAQLALALSQEIQSRNNPATIDQQTVCHPERPTPVILSAAKDPAENVRTEPDVVAKPHPRHPERSEGPSGRRTHRTGRRRQASPTSS